MQLFITSRDSQGESIVIREPRVCTHMRQVLRMKEGDEFLVQAPLYSIPGECNSDGGGFFSSLFSSCVCNTPFDIEKLSQGRYSPVKNDSACALVDANGEFRSVVTRYRARIAYVSKKEVKAHCVDTIELEYQDIPFVFAIALPNKRSTLETIVQKLTEIGVKHILVWKAERSHRPLLAEKRKKRLYKIIVEAAEQSRAGALPCMYFVDTVKGLSLDAAHVTVWDIQGRSAFGFREYVSSVRDLSSQFPHIAVCGPEGGLTSGDYAFWQSKLGSARSLGESVLRMETAACLAGWYSFACVKSYLQ